MLSFQNDKYWKESLQDFDDAFNNDSILKDFYQKKKAPLSKAKIEKLKSDTENLIRISDELNRKAISVLEIDKKCNERQQNWYDKFLGEKQTVREFKIREKFLVRLNEMGINSKGFHDNEMRYESMKREYLRYRRKRVYQQLSEIGITNRRPRHVTNAQYERFKEYQKTNKYPNTKTLGPNYVKGKNDVLVRKDVYDLITSRFENFERMVIFDNIPNMVKTTTTLFEVKDIESIESFSPRDLARVMRKKIFATWEEKIEWILIVMKKIQFSRHYFEALKFNLERRLEILNNFKKYSKILEYQVLATNKDFKNIYEPSNGPWEKSFIEGFLLRIDEQINELEKKRLLIKSEIEEEQLIHKDPLIEKICHNIRKDREHDEKDFAFLEENPFLARKVVSSKFLQRNQQRLANPDLFARFVPCDWRFIEKEVMYFINRRERANRDAEAIYGDEDLGAQNQLWTVFNHPENMTEMKRVDCRRHAAVVRELELFLPKIKWAMSIVNGTKTNQPPYFNAYLATQFDMLKELFNNNDKAMLVMDPFPYGEVDIEPTKEEADLIEWERHTDYVFAKLAVEWILSPNLGPKMGHGHNMFRFYMPPVEKSNNYTWKKLSDGIKLEDDSFAKSEFDIATMKVFSKKTTKYKKAGKVHTTRMLVVAGNHDGAVGFGLSSKNADRTAKKQMIAIPRYRNTALYHSVKAKFNGTIVKIIATPPGYGMVGPPVLRNVLLMAGVKDATIMQFGNNNRISVIKACFKALQKLTDLENIAYVRGKKIVDVTGQIDGCSYHLPRDFYLDEKMKVTMVIKSMTRRA